MFKNRTTFWSAAITLFFYENGVFTPRAEYSYFSADIRLEIFLYYSGLNYNLRHFRFRMYWGINIKQRIYHDTFCSLVYFFCAVYWTYERIMHSILPSRRVWVFPVATEKRQNKQPTNQTNKHQEQKIKQKQQKKEEK